MDVESKIELLLRPPTEEVVTVDDARSLFQTDAHPSHYIGFEISGALHLGSLVIAGFKVRDLLQAGVRCRIFLADWHTFINQKMKGDWEEIRRSLDYYAEAFRFFAPGVEVQTGSQLYAENKEYWMNVVKFSAQITLARDTRCLTILGRTRSDKLAFSQYLYPPMQAVDIWALGADIAHAGIDQRKVHMLAREVFPKLGWKKPVALHHTLLLGLEEPRSTGIDQDDRSDLLISSKMSKSRPRSCIFIHDDSETVFSKMNAAWCPPTVDDNPVLELTRNVIFHEVKEFVVDRPLKYGGQTVYESYEQLKEDYRQGKLHPADLKRCAARELNRIIEPVRNHFDNRRELWGHLITESGKG